MRFSRRPDEQEESPDIETLKKELKRNTTSESVDRHLASFEKRYKEKLRQMATDQCAINANRHTFPRS